MLGTAQLWTLLTTRSSPVKGPLGLEGHPVWFHDRHLLSGRTFVAASFLQNHARET